MGGKEKRSTARDQAPAHDSNWGLLSGVSAMLAVACVAVYSGVFDNGFVSFDDHRYIVGNHHVKLGLTAESIRWAFTHIYFDNWHPLTWLSFMLDVELFGLDPAGHHGMSVALHSANAVLLFAVLRRFTKHTWPSALVAMLFALHPLRVESVAWASERKDVLSGFFFLLTLLAYVRYATDRVVRRYAFVFVSFACGLLVKPMLVTLPILLLLLDVWPLRRVREIDTSQASDSEGLPAERLPLLRLVVEKIPLFGLSLVSGLVTLYAQSHGSTMKSIALISPIERVQNALTSMVVYLRQFLWPTDLAFFYPHPALVKGDSSLPIPLPFAWSALVSGILLVAITVYAARVWRRRPYIAVGWLWFGITLLPVIGLVQVGDQAYADRYTYLPAIGLSIAVAYTLYDRWRALGWSELPATATPNVAAAVSCVAVLAGLGVMSHRQVEVWESSEHLYRHALEVTEDNYVAAFNVGADAGEAQAYGQAIPFYNLVLQMRPEYAAAHSNLGVALKALGDIEPALEHFREALRIDPTLAHAAINLGNHATETNDIEGAREHYRVAIEARPDLALPYEVTAEFEQKQGNIDKAIHLLETALVIAPGAAQLYVRRGQLAILAGDDALAIDRYRTALDLAPDMLPAKNALALVLATSHTPTLRNGVEALELALVCNTATKFMNPTFLRTLALAHAEAGDAKESTRIRDRAIALTPGPEREKFRDAFDPRPSRHDSISGDAQ